MSLEVQGLIVRYGRLVAVRGVSLTIASGETHVILGRNGAGKSSVLGAIAGLARPAEGRVRWHGEDITAWPAHRRVAAGIALVPEGRGVFVTLTVAENLRLGGFGLPAATRRERVDEALALFPFLRGRLAAPAGTLSGGQQQMLGVARALIGQPRLLVLDEPSLGLAPVVVDEFYGQLARLRERGVTILLVEQHVERALRLADVAHVLNLGELVVSGPPDDVSRDPRLEIAYLGVKP